ncbi:hypothetical protein DY000_02040349 [Brassica cretica]|uniref:Uncharacterized protein n=1 Tax=Brassica cretica TaxID=69181 RepID=A0ABQ7BG15_BRACR|nr:hypothetical protein DY000_02040349 [Brassica cretica]
MGTADLRATNSKCNARRVGQIGDLRDQLNSKGDDLRIKLNRSKGDSHDTKECKVLIGQFFDGITNGTIQMPTSPTTPKNTKSWSKNKEKKALQPDLRDKLDSKDKQSLAPSTTDKDLRILLKRKSATNENTGTADLQATISKCNGWRVGQIGDLRDQLNSKADDLRIQLNRSKGKEQALSALPSTTSAPPTIHQKTNTRVAGDEWKSYSLALATPRMTTSRQCNQICAINWTARISSLSLPRQQIKTCAFY